MRAASLGPAGAVAVVEVSVDGATVAPDLASRLVSVRCASRLGLPTQCELVFATHRGAAAEHDRLPLGARLAVRVEGDSDDLFEGEVTCVTLESASDGASQLVVRGYDVLHRLRKRQQLRVFTEVTVDDLARRLTAEDGLQVTAASDGPAFARVVQHDQTDLDLLTEVAAAVGLHPVVEGRTLRLVSLADTGDPVRLELGVSLLEVAVSANLDTATSKVSALGWQHGEARVLAAEATSPRLATSVGSSPGLDVSGLGLLGLSGEFSLVDQPGTGERELAARAQARLDERAGRTVTLQGTAVGDARLRAGATVEATGVAEPFAGRYLLTEAIHTLDAAGYLTRLSTVPPPPLAAPARPSLTMGTVTGVDDPRGLGRVGVSLPAYGDADAGWLPVLCPGAGAGRGMVMLPDVDDIVLVALPHGPGSGIVLGSLYGEAAPKDTGVDDGKVRRWTLHTGGGQSVVLDDTRRTVTVANSGGSQVRLAPGKVTLHAAADLDIEAPGRTITVRAQAVEFVQDSGGG